MPLEIHSVSCAARAGASKNRLAPRMTAVILMREFCMPAAQSTEDRLRQIYQLLRETLEPSEISDGTEEARWHAPPLLVNVDGRTSATDLLSWWFRPPSEMESGWRRYFGDAEGPSTRSISDPSASPVKNEILPAHPRQDAQIQVAMRALADWPNDDLPNEDAEMAIGVFYGFLHAFGRKDIAEAMQYVAEDYHVFEDDREVDRQDLRSSLEALLELFHGFKLDVSLAMVPEPLGHPYGVVVYAEIQIDATNPQDGAKRNMVEPRLVLLQKQADSNFRISAFSKPRS